MKKLVLNSNDLEEINIRKIIEYVRQFEKEKGLSDEEITHKYTHGDCVCLAFLIKILLPSVKVKWFGSCSDDAHCCIAIKGDPKLDSKLEDFIDEDLYYFDINGKKYYDEMREFLSETFNTNISEINARYQGSSVGANQNETTAEVLKNTTIIKNTGEKEKVDKRKQYTIEKFVELITSPTEKIMLPLVLAGHNRMELNNKSKEELRQMVLDYITINQEDFFKALSSSDSKIVLGIQKAMILLGLPNEELYAKLGFDIDITRKESETETIDESEQYLYHTEELFEIASQEFLTSELPNSERVLLYISIIEQIEKNLDNMQ